MPARAGDHGFVTLCYHDVVPKGSDLVIEDAMPVWVENLTDHFDWLRENGWTVIGIDDVLADRSGQSALPEKSVLLSFDDGYANFHRFVFPLLKAYDYKALLALQTTWLETPEDEPVRYGDYTMPRSYFLSWDQVREMSASGHVELASHTHNLHRTHVSMPQGIQQPTAATLAYDPETASYESLDHFYARVRDDVGRSEELIETKGGFRPRVLVWPYGRYNQLGVQAALDSGYALTASLGLWDDRSTFPRFLMYQNVITLQDVMVPVQRGLVPGYSKYAGPVHREYRDLFLPQYTLQRVMHTDLDAVYDADPEQMDRNISALFDRVEAMHINTVYLQAYADPDGNGTADALYFPNRHLPMRADLFNYVAWQLQRRLNVEVYAWMPVLGFEIAGRPLVQASAPGREGSTYARLTPFDAENRRIIEEIYEDLARNAVFSGIVFHDDALLGDYEDASQAGRAWMAGIGLDASPEEIRSDHEGEQYFSRMKTKYLIDFTHGLIGAAERWSPRLKSSRNMYAQAVLNPSSEGWYAQNFADFLDAYDYVGLMAMPYMEGAASHPNKWLVKLAREVARYPLGKMKTVFELQARDWRAGHGGLIPSKILAEQMRLLQVNGIGNLGYYPEDPIAGHPNINVLYPFFSLQSNKFERKRLSGLYNVTGSTRNQSSLTGGENYAMPIRDGTGTPTPGGVAVP